MYLFIRYLFTLFTHILHYIRITEIDLFSVPNAGIRGTVGRHNKPVVGGNHVFPKPPSSTGNSYLAANKSAEAVKSLPAAISRFDFGKATLKSWARDARAWLWTRILSLRWSKRYHSDGVLRDIIAALAAFGLDLRFGNTSRGQDDNGNA